MRAAVLPAVLGAMFTLTACFGSLDERTAFPCAIDETCPEGFGCIPVADGGRLCVRGATPPSDAGPTCAPEPETDFCARLGKNCERVEGVDTCGVSRRLMCGACVAAHSCGGGGTPNVCGCSAETDVAFCARLSAACGTVTAIDACNASRTVLCGSCTAPLSCGGSGAPNQCGCQAEPDAAFCRRLGKSCGDVTNLDNCGASRAAECGACTAPAICGADNVCACAGETATVLCAAVGHGCDTLQTTDRCGIARTVDCGTCPSPQTCGGGGVPFVCGPGCVPESNETFCARLGKDCDTFTGADNCGTLRSATCGTSCPTGETCAGAGFANVCGCTSSSCTGLAYCASGKCAPGCDRDAQCGANEVCDQGTHGCVCAQGHHACSGACVSDTSLASCGSSCTPCAPPANATATCDGTSCGFTCDPGFVLSGSSCVLDGGLQPGAAWPMFGRTVAHGRRSDVVGAQTSAVKWSFATGTEILSSPAIGADGTVYVGSYDRKLYALRPDGSLKWSYTTGGAVRSSPAIGADGTVYVGSRNTSLYAFGP